MSMRINFQTTNKFNLEWKINTLIEYLRLKKHGQIAYWAVLELNPSGVALHTLEHYSLKICNFLIFFINTAKSVFSTTNTKNVKKFCINLRSK